MKKAVFKRLVSKLLDYIDQRLAKFKEAELDTLRPALARMSEDIASLPSTLTLVKGEDGKTPTVDELKEIIVPLIPAPIKGEDGKTPTVEELKEIIAPLIPAPVKGEDGKTPTVEELKEIIAPLIPAPIKGEDGKTPTVEELKEIIATLIPAPVKGEDGKTPTIEELKEIIVPLIPAPVKGEDGKTPTVDELKDLIAPLIPAPIKGEDGKTPTVDELKELIVPLIPAPIKGADGVAPTAEEVAFHLREHTRSFVTDAAFMQSIVEAVPPPRDGKDGKSVTIDDVKEFLTLQFSQWALEFERRGQDAIQRVIDNLPKPKDGMQFEDLEFDGDRTLKWLRAGVVIKEIVLPSIIDRGVWVESKTYLRGDAVSFGGNLWIAQCTTSVKPGPAGGEEGTKHWRLAVRKGRDAKDR